MSAIVNVAVVVLVLPQSSVAVKVTSSEPVAPQRSLKPVLSFDQVTDPHTSEASAPPLSANHAAKAPAGSAVPSHSTVLSAAAVSIVGAVVSAIVNVASRVMELLFESVRVNVTVSEPVAPQRSLKPVLSLDNVTLVQLSVPEKLLFNQESNSEVLPAPSHSTIKFVGALTQVGSTASSTVTTAVQVDVLPLSSVTVSVTVFAPTLVQSNELGLTLRSATPQLSEDPLFTSEPDILTEPLASN